MAEAANAVIATSGGVAVVRDGAVVASIALPIAGLLAPGPAAEVAAAQRDVAGCGGGLGGIFTPMLTQRCSR